VGEGGKKGGGKPRITALAMGEFVERLSRGENYAAAARGAGHSRSAFFELRRRDPEFAAVCEEAVARSSGKTFVHGSHGRKLQLRKTRRAVFTAGRQDVFLAHFAGTADMAASAAKAGVSESAVDKMRKRNPDFDRRFRETLDQAYVKLDALLAARRMAEQRRLRDIEPSGAPEPEFERAMKLLKRWDRRQGPPDSRSVGRGARERWDFPEAVALLERKLRNMGIPIEPLPPGHERPDGHLPLLPPPANGEDREDGAGEDEGEDGPGEEEGE
jgi:hypothetical protein